MKITARGEAPGDNPRLRPNWRKRWLMLAVVLGLLLIGLGLLRAPTATAAPQQGARNTQTAPTPLTLNRADVRVLDGDTIVLNGVHVRLYGIDAPELGQLCADKWPAGDKARGFLRVLIEGQPVSCNNRGLDKYGRTLAVCWVGTTDLNQAMVRTGNALAYSRYSRDYVLDEITARQAKAGMWAHNCQAPWDFRHGNKARP